jgi:hypothetical protein
MKKKPKCDCHNYPNQVCDVCQKVKKVKKTKKRFVKNTLKERIQFLRKAILESVPDHGAPCMCRLCEALIFDYMAAQGEINLKTGERK